MEIREESQGWERLQAGRRGEEPGNSPLPGEGRVAPYDGLSVLLDRFPVLGELGKDVFDGFGEGVPELVEILFIEEDLVLFVLFLAHPLAFGDGNIEVLLGLGRFHVEKVGPFARAHPFREDLIFVAVVIHCPALLDVS
jgi:hypothetical protein